MIRENGRKIERLTANDIPKKVWLKNGKWGILVNFINGDKKATVGIGKKFIKVSYDDISMIED